MTQVIAGIGTSQAASLELCRDSQLVVEFFCIATPLDYTQFNGSLFWGGNSGLVQEFNLRSLKNMKDKFVGNVLNICTSKSTIPRSSTVLGSVWGCFLGVFGPLCHSCHWPQQRFKSAHKYSIVLLIRLLSAAPKPGSRSKGQKLQGRERYAQERGEIQSRVETKSLGESTRIPVTSTDSPWIPCPQELDSQCSSQELGQKVESR